MNMKTIRVTGKNHSRLSNLGLKSETFDDIIERLLNFYEYENFEDFSEEKAAYYNERIKQFENGNYDGMQEVDLDAIKSRRRWN